MTALDVTCYHCGLPVTDPLRWVVKINKQAQAMCCPGCQAVAGAIVIGGLENYYRYRSEMADRGENQQGSSLDKAQQQYAVYDDDKVQAAFVVQDESGMCDAQLLIEGIHCAACCWLIEEVVRKIKGVLFFSVNLTSHRAQLQWHIDQVKLSDILLAIHSIGYRPQPWRADIEQVQLDASGKQQLMRLGVAGIVMMQAMMISFALYGGVFTGMESAHRLYLSVFGLLLMLPLMGYSAVPFFAGAWRDLHNKTLGMDVPVSLALISAFIASAITVWREYGGGHGEVYFDSISMFVFLLLLARYTEYRVRRRFFSSSAAALLPASCQCWNNEQAQYLITSVHQVLQGERLMVKAGEIIPLDGTIIAGSSSIDESAFTGEQKSVEKSSGDTLYAGTINGDGVLIIEVDKTYGECRIDFVSRLAEQSQSGKPRLLKVVDKVARYFTALVLLIAAAAAWYWAQQGDANTFSIVLAVLVVSCPCALSLATPAALSFCLLALREKGLLIRDSRCLESLKEIDTVIFDKTGTLTTGNLSIYSVQINSLVDGLSESFIKELAAALEHYSEHPIATAFKAIGTDMDVKQVEVIKGEGVQGVYNGKTYHIGSEYFCRKGLKNSEQSFPFKQIAAEHGVIQQLIYLANESQCLACFVLQDKLRKDAKEVINILQQQAKQVMILSGDPSGAAEDLAKTLGVDSCYSGISPEKKLATVKSMQQHGHAVLMVGDGINDIPVLAQADVSVAMNNASDLAKVQADGILLGDSLLPLLDLFQHVAKTQRIVKQNISWALVYNVISLPMAALGFVAPWLAALGMSLSSLWVTFNSLRLRKVKSRQML